MLATLIALTAFSWAHVVSMTHDTVHLSSAGGRLRVAMSCCGIDPALTFVMWVVMMVGMMLPSATPMILAFATVERARGEERRPLVTTALFVAGYLAVWTAFSAAAAFAQWALFQVHALDPHRQAVGPLAGGLLFAVAGLYQLTPAKRRCLARCCDPLAFVERHRRGGARDALTMGLRHGALCAGSCWMLMTLLFAVGVMNLAWVVFVTLFVLAERVLPWNRRLVRAGAVACFAVGAAMIGSLLLARAAFAGS